MQAFVGLAVAVVATRQRQLVLVRQCGVQCVEHLRREFARCLGLAVEHLLQRAEIARWRARQRLRQFVVEDPTARPVLRAGRGLAPAQQPQQPDLAVAVYEVKGEPNKILRFLMPLGLLLQPGARFSIDAGQTVAASLNTPTLFTIAQDLRQMQVEVAIDESDIGKIRQDQRVTFTVDAFSGRTFEGRVRQIRKAAQTVQKSPQQKLQELQSLYDQKLISAADYQAAKTKILNGL
mgnify:CR=1 FL=1